MVAVPAHPSAHGLDASQAVALARGTIEIEAAALHQLRERLVEGGPMAAAFTRAVGLMLACRGRVVVSGIGKSGHIARKMAATLASTGTPALFLHPAEASHGDLGMVTPSDVVLAISNSGEVEELTTILPVIKRLGVPLIGMTGRMQSTLAQQADVVLDASVEKEACPLNLAPTASTVAQLALGDALAVALLEARGFREEDFARSHPGGALGRKLLTHVRDVMKQGEAVPSVAREATFADVMLEMTRKGLGMTAVVDAAGRAVGIFTDGDLRRLLERSGGPGDRDFRALQAADMMSQRPHSVRPDALAAEAAELMERHRITQVLVTSADGTLVGALHTHDLMLAKVI
jgi:arabinose-5-phosphate isomerase